MSNQERLDNLKKEAKSKGLASNPEVQNLINKIQNCLTTVGCKALLDELEAIINELIHSHPHGR
ncbi:MAG: hypothetical protein LBB89_10180 [Treponema sp.]|jgi:hypothetical protein|nr:hypothetical protein [Treponema sp.]